jgi:hypothetical protein
MAVSGFFSVLRFWVLTASAIGTIGLSFDSMLEPVFAKPSQIQSKEDVLTGETTYLLFLKSTNEVSNSIGVQETVSLIVRCSPRSTDLYLSTPTYNGSSPFVYVRWNEGQIESQIWGTGTRNDAFFTKTPRVFLAKMLENQSLILGWTPYGSARVAARYELEAYKDDLKQMTLFCVRGR